eukprot:6135843-Pleurochrysis_carterae.AAC.1
MAIPCVRLMNGCASSCLRVFKCTRAPRISAWSHLCALPVIWRVSFSGARHLRVRTPENSLLLYACNQAWPLVCLPLVWLTRSSPCMPSYFVDGVQARSADVSACGILRACAPARIVMRVRVR